MSRIPPSLLYFTIYNPTLKPTLLDPDNEDAEEQSHILFYTAREHVVSRDKILRQIGLAKAMVNFSATFNGETACESVHSQARRMIIFSPEPGFWMHATPRPPPVSTKSKSSSQSKSKGKEREALRPAPIYDYHDSSLHDIALRAHLQRGYEEFKLLHGSFSTILSSVGQEGLQLQLDRFFTVFAWKWDVGDDNFGTGLGLPRHPLYPKLATHLEKFASNLSDELMAFVLIPPYVIPSLSPRYPAALVRYVLKRIPPPMTPSSRHRHKPSWPPPSAALIAAQKPPSGDTAQSAPIEGGLLGLSMPTMPAIPPMNLDLDVKKLRWGWPGYLTFGKGGAGKATPGASEPSSTSASLAAVAGGPPDPKPPDAAEDASGADRKDAQDVVDTASLQEAISSEGIGSYTRATSPTPSALSRNSQLGESSHGDAGTGDGGNVSPVHASSVDVHDGRSESVHLTVPGTARLPSSSPEMLPPVRSAIVNLASSEDPSKTERKRLLHFTHGGCTVAFIVDLDHTLDMDGLVEKAMAIMTSMETMIAEESGSSEQQIPTAANILQPKDKYIVSSGEYTTTGAASFPSRSEHLYSGQGLLRSAMDISEVFSRGQDPQHWYVGKRGLGAAGDGRQVEGEAYMEVARKEATLTDVDNALAGVVRRFVERMW